MTVRILVNGDHVRDRLPPWELVRVMLEGSDEDDRSLLSRDASRQVVLAVKAGRHAQPKNADHLVDRRGRPGTAEDDRSVAVPADRLMNDPAGVLTQTRCLQAGARGLGVRVSVPRNDLAADEVLDACEPASTGAVVRVGTPARAVGPPHNLVLADHGTADLREERTVTEVGCRRDQSR